MLYTKKNKNDLSRRTISLWNTEEKVARAGAATAGECSTSRSAVDPADTFQVPNAKVMQLRWKNTFLPTRTESAKLQPFQHFAWNPDSRQFSLGTWTDYRDVKKGGGGLNWKQHVDAYVLTERRLNSTTTQLLHLRIAYFKIPFDPPLYRWLHLE